MQYNNQPLVSVSVVTYNSSKTVVETLNSIFNQTYQKLELIVSDDCSTDNTVEICREWIDAHKERFERAELLMVEKNTGVAANMNRAADACRGEWVKDIAGDDVLLPDCVETYVDYVQENPEAVCVFANVDVFGGSEGDRKYWEDYFSIEQEFFTWSNEEQYDYLTLIGNHIPAATAFYNRGKFVELGVRNDERTPFLEDRPKWITLLKEGVHFDYINKVTAKYRLSDSSLWRKTPEKFIKSQAKVYLYYCFRNDFKKRSKKKAILKWIRSQRVVHDNAVVWRILSKLYRTMFDLQ